MGGDGAGERAVCPGDKTFAVSEDKDGAMMNEDKDRTLTEDVSGKACIIWIRRLVCRCSRCAAAAVTTS